jgi:predicted dehydrogenase
MSNIQPVRVAVVGTGNMGAHHARIYAEMPAAELVGVVDLDEARGRACAKRFNTRWYADYRELVGQVQAVSIVVPTCYHYEQARFFLEHDVHVLVEKPIAVAIEEASSLVELARARGLVLQVGHLERFNPAVSMLKQIVRKPIYIETRRLTWPQRRNTDVGVIWDLMIHDLDILLNFVDEPVESVQALGRSLYSDHEDLASVQVRFRSGCIASLLASRISGERLRQLQVVEEREGSIRTLSLDFINQTLSVAAADPDKPGTPPEYIPIKKEEPLRLELEHFADCVLTNRTPLVSGEDGKRALELAISAVKNMRLVDSKAPFEHS